MKNLAVNWYEGLFLRPQHLQSMERHWNETQHLSNLWSNPYSYGLYSIEISKEAIGNNQFEVRTLEARMRDGTLVSLKEGQEPDRISLKERQEGSEVVSADLKEAFEKQPVLLVYLAIPKLNLGRINTASDTALEPRYLQQNSQVHDENRGIQEEPIQYRRLNAKLLLSTDDLSGYEVLPIARIKRASEGEAAPQLDDAYIPPILSISSWPEMGLGVVRGIYDIIGQKISVLSQQVINRGMVRGSSDPGEAERVAMLDRLNEAYVTLGLIAFSRGVHPASAYLELCRIVGQLSIFGPERRAGEMPPYDHDDLARIFTFVRRRIEELIYVVRDYEFQQRFFVGLGLGMQVSLESRWFNSDWQWFIGVKKEELTQQEIRDLLSPGQLDWKLGSSRQVEILFQRRSQGVQLSPLDRPIRALPASRDWVFYEVDKGTPAWRDVQETQTLAMRLRDSLITNLDRLQGERDIVVQAGNRRAKLQFALFAVPTNRT